MRITGLSGSGLDVESMVTALLQVEQITSLRMENSAIEDQIRLAAWNQVSTAVSDVQSKAQQLTSFSTWQQMTAGSSNEDVLTALADDEAPAGEFDLDVAFLASAHRIGSDAQTAADTDLGYGGQFTIGGVDITVANGDSLNDVRDAINLASASMSEENAVRALVIDTTLVLERKQTGATEIQIDDDGDGILGSLGMVDASLVAQNELQEARDLTATISGVDISRSTNTGLTNVIEGVTLNIHETGQSTLTVERDTPSLRSMIEDFVASYNKAMEVTERESSNDVEDEGSERGMLQGDGTIRSFQFNVRQLVTSTDSSTLDPAFNSLRKIGIWTTGEDNRLEIVDSDALDNALNNNWDDVESLFRDYDAGVVRSLDSYLESLTRAGDGIFAVRQDTIKNRISDTEDRIFDEAERLASYEDQLWEKFGRLEAVMAQLNAQSGFIASLMPSTSSNN